MVKTITDVFPVIQDKKTALVLMGHGTEHYANTVYAALDYRFKDMGYENVIVATVEGYPEIDQALNQLEKSDAKKVVIAPFMIVAGDHAKNDMAGEEADSWKNVIGAKGYKVETVLKGLRRIRKQLSEAVCRAYKNCQIIDQKICKLVIILLFLKKRYARLLK
ncbi:MAG: sirohydrochlorin cobaltochelatase [Ruminococcus sp.]